MYTAAAIVHRPGGRADPVLALVAGAVAGALGQRLGDGVLAGRRGLHHGVELERALLGEHGVVVPEGDEAGAAAAGVHVHAERLDVAAGDVGAQGAGRREHAERDRVDAGDRQGAVLVGDPDDLGAVGLDGAEVAGALPVDGGERVVQLGAQVVEVDHAGLAVPLVEADLGAVRHRLGLAERARLHQPHRAHVRRDQHLVAAGDAPGHAERAPGHVAPVVDGVGDGVVVEQLAEHAVELEAREVLAEVGVVAAAVGADELGPVDDLVDDRRHVVLPAAGAAEVEVVDARGVLVEQALDVPAQIALREDRRRDVEACP